MSRERPRLAELKGRARALRRRMNSTSSDVPCQSPA